MKAIKILILVSIIGIFFCGKTLNSANDNTINIENDFLILEAENYNDKIGQIRVEEKLNASNNRCVHIGPDSDVVSEGIGDALIFNFSLERDFSMGVFEICYSDDVGGNIIHVYLDDKNEGCFGTETTGGWNNFELDSQKIDLGYLNKGSHTIKLEMTKGGSWGVLIDYFKITNVEPIDRVTGAYNYIKSLINKNTGLVRSADYEKDFTTVYKNALAAIVFIHENDLNLAEGIFDFFKSKYNKNYFRGFNQFWDPETGNERETNYWEGDNAFLLLALNYYNEVTGSFGNYEDMVDGLVQWLSERADADIIAEGLANMYSALKPFENFAPGIDTVLLRLESGFHDKKDYQAVLDHIERGALCFSDISGFDYIDGFKRAEIWEYDDTEVNGLAAFISENFINVEITAQILLAWKIWKSDLSIDLSCLEREIDKLWLLGASSHETVSYGLPYFLSYDPSPQTGHGWPGCYDEPIIDTTCYMLFYYWNFNPMAPGRKGENGEDVKARRETQYEVIYTSQDLSGYSVFAECNPGGETSCTCSDNDVSIASFGSYGEVASNVREINTYVNAIGYKKFIETFPNGNPIILGVYKYSVQIKLPVLPHPNVDQKENPQAVHIMIQLWDGRDFLFPNDKITLEGAIYWELNPWSSDYGKIKVYTNPVNLIETNIALTPDTDWHTFELIVNFMSKKYVSIAIDGESKNLNTIELAQVHQPDWDEEVSLSITTESMAAWPQSDCSNIFTWATRFKELKFSYLNFTGIIIPAYFYPSWWDDNTNQWDDLIEAAADVPIIAIMNPASGPGTDKILDYERAVQEMHDAGGEVIGYVSTSYGNRTITACKAEVDAYYNWYDIDGIFFDEMSNNPDDLPYYKELYNYVKDNHPDDVVIGNPGANTSREYLEAATVLVIFENNVGYTEWNPPDWVGKYSSSSFSNLIYGTSDRSVMESYMDSAVARNIGWIYITDDVLPNPWDTLPEYWKNEIEYIRRDIKGTCLDDFDNPDTPYNLFIATRGSWCCSSGNDCNVCNEENLIISFDKVIRCGAQGASLKLTYNIEQEDSLASYYEYLHSGGTYYDLSDFDEFSFWVRGEKNSIGNDTKFYIRFADKNWNMEYVEIKGISGDDWEKKTIDLKNLTKVDFKQMNELTIMFKNNGNNDANPLCGTLYFDNLSFIDNDIDIGSDDKFLDLLEKKAFRYFWEYADPETGLIRDRASNPDVCSIAAVGFGLTSVCIAEKRGWISYDEAYSRVLTTLNSFYDDPDDPEDFCVEGTHGLFWHFVNIHDGTPMYWDGVSTIDSALLMAGVLTCRQYFAGTHIETLATKIYEAAEWDWFVNDDGLISMKWTPSEGLTGYWGGYNEAMILYLVAIGSPTHPIPATSWDDWASFYEEHWGAYYGYQVLACPALFTHQFSHCWIDFRNKKDTYMNYFQNSVFASLANRAYSKDVWYPESNIDIWGITASEGPNPGTCTGKVYRSGLGYPPDTGNNDGTVAPTAAGGSIVFTPEYSISTLMYMFDYFHQKLWGLYGLKDSLNTICDPDWFANEYIGIDVGPIIIMIENYRTELIWDIFMKNEEITSTMEKVGFKPDNSQMQDCFYYQEAEDYKSISGDGINVEDHLSAWSRKTLQIGEEPNNSVTYEIDLNCEGNTNLFFEIRYSDDVAGNKIDVYIDDVKKGSFITDKFGSWEDFSWDDERISLGIIAPGAHTIKLKVAEDGGGSWGVNLDAFKIIAYPDIALSPAGYDFGDVRKDSTISQIFTIFNNGDEYLNITGINLSDTSDFALDENGGLSPCGNTTPIISSNSSCTFNVIFSPSSPGPKEANLTINSNDPDTPNLTVSLLGNGISPNILVSPTSYDFGEVVIDHSATHNFAISNTGDADLDIFNVLLSDTENFNIQSDECSNQSIRPNESCIVKINFSPKSVGEKTSELTISSNDPDTPTLVIPLRGKGKGVCFIESL